MNAKKVLLYIVIACWQLFGIENNTDPIRSFGKLKVKCLMYADDVNLVLKVRGVKKFSKQSYYNIII